ncbi:hypothetical protein VTO73DRAFT_7278 [Trametes versicolor]
MLTTSFFLPASFHQPAPNPHPRCPGDRLAFRPQASARRLPVASDRKAGAAAPCTNAEALSQDAVFFAPAAVGRY